MNLTSIPQRISSIDWARVPLGFAIDGPPPEEPLSSRDVKAILSHLATSKMKDVKIFSARYKKEEKPVYLPTIYYTDEKGMRMGIVDKTGMEEILGIKIPLFFSKEQTKAIGLFRRVFPKCLKNEEAQKLGSIDIIFAKMKAAHADECDFDLSVLRTGMEILGIV